MLSLDILTGPMMAFEMDQWMVYESALVKVFVMAYYLGSHKLRKILDTYLSRNDH